MLDASALEHLPDGRIAPEVRSCLRPDGDVEVIMTPSHHDWAREIVVPVKTDQVLPKLLERSIKGHLVILTLAHSVADESTTVADVEQDTPVVHSVQRGDIRDGV